MCPSAISQFPTPISPIFNYDGKIPPGTQQRHKLAFLFERNSILSLTDQRTHRQTGDGPFKCYFCQTPKWHKRLQTDAHSLHSLTRIIQLSLRLFFKTSKHTRAADRPDDVVTSFVKPALRLQAPLLSCVRVCTWGWESVCAAKTSRSLFQGNVQMRSAAGPFAYLHLWAARLFVLHVDFATCLSLPTRNSKGKTKSFQPHP
jgi:hypothetical protein